MGRSCDGRGTATCGATCRSPRLPGRSDPGTDARHSRSGPARSGGGPPATDRRRPPRVPARPRARGDLARWPAGQRCCNQSAGSLRAGELGRDQRRRRSGQRRVPDPVLRLGPTLQRRTQSVVLARSGQRPDERHPGGRPDPGRVGPAGPRRRSRRSSLDEGRGHRDGRGDDSADHAGGRSPPVRCSGAHGDPRHRDHVLLDVRDQPRGRPIGGHHSDHGTRGHGHDAGAGLPWGSPRRWLPHSRRDRPFEWSPSVRPRRQEPSPGSDSPPGRCCCSRRFAAPAPMSGSPKPPATSPEEDR